MALIIVLVGCGQTPVQYTLSISSTPGGTVTSPGVGISGYDEGTVVDLVAEAKEGYHLANWIGDVGTVGNINAAITTITMNGDYSITTGFRVNSPPMVATNGWHTVGLKLDNTVIATGNNYEGQCDVGNWTNVIQVTTGAIHTLGLKADGTVIAVGANCYGQSNVAGWVDIVQVAAGYSHTVALKSDGTVVAVGDNEYGQCEVGGWMLGEQQFELAIG
jgi:alpha-tubulin suppressor-like RCC1 family protein